MKKDQSYLFHTDRQKWPYTYDETCTGKQAQELLLRARRPQLEYRARRKRARTIYLQDPNEARIDRKLRAQPFDGKSFHGLREALARRFQSGWRPQ